MLAIEADSIIRSDIIDVPSCEAGQSLSALTPTSSPHPEHIQEARPQWEDTVLTALPLGVDHFSDHHRRRTSSLTVKCNPIQEILQCRPQLSVGFVSRLGSGFPIDDTFLICHRWLRQKLPRELSSTTLVDPETFLTPI